MIDKSLFLKVDKKGVLMMLDITRESGEIVVPGKEWESAVCYTIHFELVNKSYQEFLSKIKSPKDQ